MSDLCYVATSTKDLPGVNEIYDESSDSDQDYILDEDYVDNISNSRINPNFSLTDLTSYLCQSSMNVRYLLQHPLSMKFIFAKHKQIVSYLSDHINDLLALIFSNEEKLAMDAYNVFGYLQSNLIDSILSSSNFHNQIVSVLQNQSSSSCHLSRVCNMTLLAITMSSESFPQILDFITLFPLYIEHDPIVNFFEEIFQDDPSYSFVQEWLLQNSFPEHIIELIRSIKFTKEESTALNYFSNTKCQKLTNLFKLIHFCNNCTPIMNCFRNKETVTTILSFENMPSQTEDAKWAALDSIYNKQYAYNLSFMFNPAFSTVSASYIIINNFRLSALHILQNILHYDKSMINSFKNRQICQILIRLIFQFQTNTFVLLQIQDFLSEALKKKEINLLFAENIIPFLVFEGTKKENLLMSAFSFKVIEMSISYASKDNDLKMALMRIDDFSSFLSGPLKQRRIIMKENYGGRLPVSWA